MSCIHCVIGIYLTFSLSTEIHGKYKTPGIKRILTFHSALYFNDANFIFVHTGKLKIWNNEGNIL